MKPGGPAAAPKPNAGPSSPVRTLQSAVPVPPAAAIRFGANANQEAHAFRHVLAYGLDRDAIEQAIRSDLGSRLGSIPEGLYNGTVVVNGVAIKYASYRFQGGIINVGRITPSR